VVTVAAEFPFDEALPGTDVHCVRSELTTVFRNCYGSGGRRQVIKQRADDIRNSDVPPAWRSARMVLLAPLVGEFPPDAVRWFDSPLVGAVAQGWLRTWDDSGRVSIPLSLPDLPSDALHLLVLSEADAGFDVAARLTGSAEVLAFTRGAAGVRLCIEGRWHEVSAPRAEEVDPTGAGDVWAAAYLIRYSETGDPFEAARFACAAGALCVEAPGLAGIRGRSDIETRLAGGNSRSV